MHDIARALVTDRVRAAGEQLAVVDNPTTPAPTTAMDFGQRSQGGHGGGTIAIEHVTEAVRLMASMPLDTNVQYMTVLPTTMPYIGRG